MLRNKIISILLAVMAMTLSARAEKYTIGEINGKWRFHIGDNMQWAQKDFDDSKWALIKVPSEWESQGYAGYDGFAWYRVKIFIPSEAKNEQLAIELGYIDDADEVYFNGVMIGKTGSLPPQYNSAYNAFRRYQIPANLIMSGKANTLAVRVYDKQSAGGIVDGNMKLVSFGVTVHPNIDLAGSWDFCKGLNFSAEMSTKILVPGAWENQGFGDYDGFAVYHNSFTADANLAKQQLTLMAGRIDDLDEVYINGVLVGKIGNFATRKTDNHHKAWRNYIIPEGVVKPGKNIIEIKVFDKTGRGGIIEGTVGIFTQERFVEYWRNKRSNK